MKKYIDLVACTYSTKRHPVTFQAPAWSGLKKGDVVVVETGRGDAVGNVESVYTVDNSDEKALDFILTASGAHTPLRKIKKKVVYQEFDYKEAADE